MIKVVNVFFETDRRVFCRVTLPGGILLNLHELGDGEKIVSVQSNGETENSLGPYNTGLKIDLLSSWETKDRIGFYSVKPEE